MEIWDKIRRYLFIWLVIFVIVVLISIIANWSLLCQILATSVKNVIMELVILCVGIGIIVYFLRTIFR